MRVGSQVHVVVLLRSHVTIALPCFSTKAAAVMSDGMPATADLRAAGEGRGRGGSHTRATLSAGGLRGHARNSWSATSQVGLCARAWRRASHDAAATPGAHARAHPRTRATHSRRAQPCGGGRWAAAPRQKLSRRVRARAFGGGVTDLRGARSVLGGSPGALRRPRATLDHLLPLRRPLDPVCKKVASLRSVPRYRSDVSV